MNDEKAINQLYSLIEDRQSFFTEDGDDEIYHDDCDALMIGIKAIQQNKELRNVLSDLVYKVGYCHNFQRERVDIFAWIYAVCKIQKKAEKLLGGKDDD